MDRHPEIPVENPERLEIFQKALILKMIFFFQWLSLLFRIRISDGPEGVFWSTAAVLQFQPAFFPDHFLDRGLPSQGAVEHSRKISAAEMSQEPAIVRPFHKARVTGFLEETGS